MNKIKFLSALVLGMFLSVFILILNSCNSVDSNVTIKSADLAKELEGGKFEKVGTTFGTEDGPLHLFVVVTNTLDSSSNSHDSIKVKASWYAIEAKDEKNVLINETVFVIGNEAETELNYKLYFPRPWLPGKYKVDLFLNGKLDRSIPFDVKE